MSEDLIAILSHIGSGVVGGLIVLLANHFLTRRRDLDKEQRARDEAAAKESKAIEAALHLTPIQREIISYCAAEDAPLRGFVERMTVDGCGSWIVAGKRAFTDQSDPSVQAKYLDAFESMLARGFFRHESGTTYRLVAIGYEKAKNDT